MKKRRINCWIYLIVPFIAVCCAKDEEEIFVFPSMQMEGLASNSASKSGEHVPLVEVIYRGQPQVKITSTTMSSSEVITQTTRGKLNFFFHG